jgi:hypothetical protein
MALSGLSKYKIAVDTAALADGDSIAAYLTSAAGDLITSTTVGAKEALDALTQAEHVDGSAYSAGNDYLASMGVVDDSGNWVPLTLNAAGELPVSASIDQAGDYAEDSAHTSGDVGLFQLSVRRDSRASGTSADGDYASFNTNSVGELYVKDTDVETALTAANASLDAIETSVAAIESDADAIRVELLDQGTTLDSILADTTAILADTAAIEASVASIDTDTAAILAELLDQGTTLDSILADTATIDSQTLTISTTLTALSKAEDAAHSSGDQGIQALAVRKDAAGSNAADGDYTSLLTWSEGSLKVVDNANSGVLQQQVTLATAGTAQQIPATSLANRRNIMIQNTSNNPIFIGSSTVTTSGATKGVEVPKGAAIELDAGPDCEIWAVSGSNTQAIVVLESA